MIQVVGRAIAPQEVLDTLKCDASGSVVMHIGIVRPSSEGKRVSAIEYQAERTQAEQELSNIGSEVKSRWEIQDVALCRRIGRLSVGEIILVAAISAPHRKDAFEACQFAVERLRGMSSVKKEEVYE